MAPEMGPRLGSGEGLFRPLPGGWSECEAIVQSWTERLKCGNQNQSWLKQVTDEEAPFCWRCCRGVLVIFGDSVRCLPCGL